MWVCNQCHIIDQGTPIHEAHLFGSRGSCEFCGFTRDCAHCKCPPGKMAEGPADAELTDSQLAEWKRLSI